MDTDGIRERFRYIRKHKLGMTQEKLAEALGVNRGVIKNFELDILKRPEQKLPLIKLLAEKYNINEHWLLTGEGSPDDVPEFSLDAFAREHNATPLELKAMQAYFSVDYDTRQLFMSQFLEYIRDYEKNKAKKEALHQELDHELKNQKKAEEKSIGSDSSTA